MNEVLGLDPLARGLPATERYLRSALLLKLAHDSLAGCAGSAPPPEIGGLDPGKSDKVLNSRVRLAEESDAMDANMDLALE